MRLPLSLRSKITPSCATAIVVSLLPLVYFFPATRGRLIISPDDGVIFNIPLRVAVANMIRGGYLPLWNPYIFSGMPLFGAAQAGVLFPLNWFYLIFSAPVATNLMMLSTYMLAALGAYLYARRSGSSISGAALTSLVWQWSGFLIGQIGHTNILHTAALLPWMLWAIDGYGATGKRSRGVLLAAIVAVQVFAGHQQTCAYALMVAAVYALVMWRSHSRRSGQGAPVTGPSPAHDSLYDPRARAYVWSLLLIVAGLLLAAVQILPTLELLRNSMRADASYDFFTSFSLPRRFLWTFFAPFVVGGGDGNLFRAPYVGPAFYAEYVGYVGLITIALSLVCVLLKRDARTKFWAVVVVAGLLLALGRYAPFGFYKIIYAVPVLNLFRVPARHLMEVEFALAVLAGRGLTAITKTHDLCSTTPSLTAALLPRTLRSVGIAGAVVFVLTCLAITLGRPANFQLGRSGPVSILRAPELFLPVVMAALSACALWFYAKGRRRGLLLLLAVLAFDLCLWGQSSGWRASSPKSDFELWGTPETVKFLRSQPATGSVRTGSGSDRVIANGSDRTVVDNAEPYRILTQDVALDPDSPAVASPQTGAVWIPSLQPDVYMMYGLENAAGYDGFGLARYSRLAGDMKVWGDLTDANLTLGDASRELDLLNVRYLLARSSSATAAGEPTSAEFPAATEVYGGQSFVADNFNVPSIVAGERLSFKLPPTEVDHVALLTNLAWSEVVPDRAVVARLRLQTQDGETFNFELRAGEHTAEWAHDRPDIRARIKHQRAPVATSYEVADGPTKYEAHTYVSSFALPRSAVITGGEIAVARIPTAPQLTLSLGRLTLAGGARAFPLRSEWLQKESAADAESPSERDNKTPSRWQRVAETGQVAVFENTRMLPRAWLATGELVMTEEQELAVIRSGKTPDGATWNPLTTALVESSTGVESAQSDPPSSQQRSANVIVNEPGRVEVKTAAAAPSLLVLSANHYPGWRAFVDERPVEVVRVNYNLRGVALPAGNHDVRFVYQPKSVLVGFVISLLTLAALMVWSRMPRFGVR
jgi:hypothetical protein